jgi:hypothetical protein
MWCSNHADSEPKMAPEGPFLFLLLKLMNTVCYVTNENVQWNDQTA